MQTGDVTPFRLSGTLRLTAFPRFSHVVERGIERALGLDVLDRIYRALPQRGDPDRFLDEVLRRFGIGCTIESGDTERIPASGPTVVVANHPFGAIEGLVLAQLLRRIRPDVRILANRLLARIPELGELVIGVDNLGGGDAMPTNVRSMRQAIDWVRAGGLLLVFPAGTVSHFQLSRRRVTDPAWHRSTGRLVQLTAATVVPIYVHGANSAAFHVAGLVHARLRTAMLPRELLNKTSTTVRLGIGQAIPPLEWKSIDSADELVRYLRIRTYVLARVVAERGAGVRATGASDQVAAPVPAAMLKGEVDALPETARLVSSGRFSVYCARADQMPWCLQEIGRLRELAFRAAGEGTGRARDIDLYDAYYRHLFVWDGEADTIVGAYRLGLTDEVLARYGKRGLYTQSLFDYGRRVLDQLSPGIELGRSFVRPEYQRTPSALPLLWQGIGRFVASSPRHAVLFGPVSISNHYTSTSRRLLVDFLGKRAVERSMAIDVRARHPFRARRSPLADELDVDCLNGIEQVSRLVAELEPDGKGVPVLLRQYLKLGGRILGFNIDAKFGDALDALIVVDLRETPSRELARYMGKEGASAFARIHADRRLRQAS